MVSGYVLIKGKTGLVQSAVKEMKEIQEIESADIVTGRYDIIVKINVEETNDILNIVTGEIQGIEGINKTTTCIAT